MHHEYKFFFKIAPFQFSYLDWVPENNLPYFIQLELILVAIATNAKEWLCMFSSFIFIPQ
jgi:hypothetical protein